MLGTGNSNSSETPIVVPGLPSIRSISCGAFHSVALSHDGRAFVWGKGANSRLVTRHASHITRSGANGRLGLGGNSDRSTPVCISDFDGMQVDSVGCGAEHSSAVNADGQVFCWGKNRHGELGMESCVLPPLTSSSISVLFLWREQVQHTRARKLPHACARSSRRRNVLPCCPAALLPFVCNLSVIIRCCILFQSVAIFYPSPSP